jgi:hypothetical protein
MDRKGRGARNIHWFWLPAAAVTGVAAWRDGGPVVLLAAFVMAGVLIGIAKRREHLRQHVGDDGDAQ